MDERSVLGCTCTCTVDEAFPHMVGKGSYHMKSSSSSSSKKPMVERLDILIMLAMLIMSSSLKTRGQGERGRVETRREGKEGRREGK